ncbi:MAG: hypothetical protein IJY39_05235 [Clostridia bacterium]|nr:hypothetical protein [Clostridia bacterium]
MMNRMKKTEYLLREIGEIDDRLLHEAVCYKPVRRSSYKWGMLAACLALIFVLSVAGPLMRALSNVSGENVSDAVPEVYTSLDELLLDSEDRFFEVSDPEALSYTGSASLVWKDSESGRLYQLYLSDYQFSRLKSEMGKGDEVGESSPKLSCQVWVLDGEGNVRSPYLKDNTGNVGCDIFDYEAEILPTEALIRCISEMLS